MRDFSTLLYLVSIVGAWALSLLIPFVVMFCPTGTAGAIILVWIWTVSIAYSIIVTCMLWYEAWMSIQDGYAGTTPGRAVGFLFIPLFNLYWIFQLIWGFSRDYNRYIRRHNIKSDQLSERLFLRVSVYALFLGVVTASLIVVYKLCISIVSIRRHEQVHIRTTKSLLQVQNLHKVYPMGSQNLRILQGINLSVRRGEWIAIFGASGSGKSTLLHLIGGLDTPQDGSIRFAGMDMVTWSAGYFDAYRAKGVGFVFQFYHLLPELTALENVVLGSMVGQGTLSWPGARSKVRRHASELLDRLGLGERLRHKPAKLSGGERQRVAIARALINDPPLLLADEPTGNLDAQTGAQLLDVFAQFHRAGQTIVMVTHDQKIAQAAQRRLTLENGRLHG